MPNHSSRAFHLDEWLIEPDQDRLVSGDNEVTVEPKTMAVLVFLKERADQVVSSDDIINTVWDGRPMGDNPVHKCISRLRSALGDDASRPRFIKTIPTKGYQLIASVTEVGVAEPADATPRQGSVRAGIGMAVLLLAALTGYFLFTAQDDSASPPDVGSPSVAVLPFDNLGHNESDNYFVDGVAESIRALLSQIEGVSVASRTSSRVFRNQSVPVAQIGEKLGVAKVLEGTVQRDGGQVRITVQLIDVQSGFPDWSEIYRQEFENLFAIEDEIARVVVKALKLHIVDLPDRGTNSINAYDDYLRGQEIIGRSPDEADYAAAIALFERALERDPQYARAYAGLCQTFEKWYEWTRATGYADKAEANCAKAESLDAQLSDVPIALGNLYRSTGQPDKAIEAYSKAIQMNASVLTPYIGIALAHADRDDMKAAEAAHLRAIDIAPYDYVAYSEYALVLFRSGRYADAARNYQKVIDLGVENAWSYGNLGGALQMMGDLEMASRAYARAAEIQPTRTTVSNLGTIEFYLGRYDRAAEQYRKAVELAPQDRRTWGNLGDALAMLPGEDAQARDVFMRAIELSLLELETNPRSAVTQASLGAYYARVGQRDKSLERLRTAKDVGPTEIYVYYYSAVAYVLLDEFDQALESLTQLRDLGFPLDQLQKDPVFHPLRARSDYQKLVTNT